MIPVGEEAPDFESDTSEGPIHLKQLRGSPVVLYFYPQADTSGCTIESKKFRDLMPSFREHGVRIVGVSTDSVPEQKAWAEKCSLPFPLVADTTKAITRSYGVLSRTGRARRVTFLLDAAGKVIEVVEDGAPLPHVAAAEKRFLHPSG
jgi:peroxiredoxin Q/BCP